jgi:hypothetical protein
MAAEILKIDMKIDMDLSVFIRLDKIIDDRENFLLKILMKLLVIVPFEGTSHFAV